MMSASGGSIAIGGGEGGAPSEMPPALYFGSDQYAVCNNFKIAKGRDLSHLDIKRYGQVCVLG
ncbi:MAG: multidrug ABC transporter permease, partial [Ruthenibacterium sp.]